MTELQKVEFEMLKEFIRICVELDITYYLVCGSALGAVKYKGFIPWDDDLDVALMRSDYERFIERAPPLLPGHLFLQNYKTDKNIAFFYSKLRNSNTTYIEKSVSKLQMNHGVYIDIFPLDGYPKTAAEQKRLEFKKTLYRLQLSCVYEQQCSKKAAAFFTVERMLGFHRRTRRTVEKLDRLLSAYTTEDSEFVCNHGNWQGKLEYAPRGQYGGGAEAEFEGIRVNIPERYDEYLTQKYGDWRADLPEEQKVGHHYYEVMDLEHPYTDYCSSTDSRR